jgi:hypothetical protein
MAYLLDSSDKYVELNTNQKVDMYLKVKAKYNDTVEF